MKTHYREASASLCVNSFYERLSYRDYALAWYEGIMFCIDLDIPGITSWNFQENVLILGRFLLSQSLLCNMCSRESRFKSIKWYPGNSVLSTVAQINIPKQTFNKFCMIVSPEKWFAIYPNETFCYDWSPSSFKVKSTEKIWFRNHKIYNDHFIARHFLQWNFFDSWTANINR